jgi:hypothetical protein
MRLNYSGLLSLILSIFISISSSLVFAQAKKEPTNPEPKSGAEGLTGNLVKIEGKIQCSKPDKQYSIDVSDRPGHSLMISERKCSWSEPFKILNAHTKDGVTTHFTEKMEGELHMHGFEVDTLDDGEKLTFRTMGEVLGEKGPATTKGRWSYMRGTGKYKGIKGGGTYEGKMDADGGLTLEFEGAYVPAEMAAEKKNGGAK